MEAYHKKTDKIYKNSPIIIQNMMITLYGIYIQRARYKGEYNKYFHIYTENLNKTPDKIYEYQNKKLNNILQQAYQEVPYYNKIFNQYGIDISKIKTKDDLRVIPYLEKSTIRNKPNEFISKKHNINKLYNISTTGTTGTPLNIFCDRRVRQKNYAFYNRWLKSIGVDPGSRKATFGGRLVVPIEQNTGDFWRTSLFQRNTYFSSYHFLPENMNAIVEKIKRLKPDYIDAYPSSIYTVAQHILKNNIDMKIATKAIITSAETLFDNMREVIEEAFNAPVYDQYGSAEMCVFMAQCSRGRYHVHNDYSIIEFINEHGKPAKVGELAEVVCTGLINDVMPLIRYRIGDTVELSKETCSCGMPFQVVTKIIGRTDDYILTPEGRKVGRLSPVMKKYPVREVQYIQENIHELNVVIVADDGYVNDTEKCIEKEIQKRVGSSIAIRFVYKNKINRENGGKYRSIVSYIK
jgi:phenylacetate-CoA ligase